MGFYGNITNTARTQFEFDRIYASRFDMDQHVNDDGIYIGRYVLVNYEDDKGDDYFLHAYKNIIDGQYYFGHVKEDDQIHRFLYVATPQEVGDSENTVYEGQIILIPADGVHNLINPSAQEYWQVQGSETVDGIAYASFIRAENLYTANYNQDLATYQSSRGYDSTVWQKVHRDGNDKYVMVAELNTMTPIFDIGAADAPKIVPVVPHFGLDSTNIYYKLHWSPSWGFRVKAANPLLRGPKLNDSGNSVSGYVPMSSDETTYLSDEETRWYKTAYDSSRDEMVDYTFGISANNPDQGVWGQSASMINAKGVPAAIYYNKDGFNPETISYGYIAINDDDINEIYQPNKYYIKVDGKYTLATDNSVDLTQHYYEKIDNHITLQPTGFSGRQYNVHDGKSRNAVKEQVDTQELSIMLPAIGNTIAAVWDLIYGGEDVNENGERNLDISWEFARTQLERRGLRLITDFKLDGVVQEDQGYFKTKNVETLAGAINSVHDLMGMIITPNIPQDTELLDENRIYYDEREKTFNRKRLFYEDEAIDFDDDEVYEFVEVEINEDDYAPNCYYILNNNNYQPDLRDSFTSGETYYLRQLIIDSEYEPVTDDLERFDGTQYGYADYFGNNNYYDYVRDEKYYNDKKYYNWGPATGANPQSICDAMSEVDVDTDYQPGIFYIKDNNGNFVLDKDIIPKNQDHYTLNPAKIQSIATLGYTGVYLPNMYAYETTTRVGDQDVLSYKIDNNANMTIEDPPGQNPPAYRKYYALKASSGSASTEPMYIKNEIWSSVVLTEQTYEPYVYYTQPNSAYISTAWDPDQTLYYKRDLVYTLITDQTEQFTVDTSQVVSLMQFHTNEFFTKDSDGYKVVTGIASIENIPPNQIYVLKLHPNQGSQTYEITNEDLVNNTECAFTKLTKEFYEPNRYYYLTDEGNYSSFVLDTYKHKTTNRTYFRLDTSKLGVPIELNIFEAYKYYEKISDNEYQLIIDDSDIPNEFYKHNDVYYVYSDDQHLIAPGAKWNFGVTYVPPTITLARRSEHYGLEPLKGFARDITTMHGLILKIKALLDDENELSRDVRTVHGALNTLNDKIAQFSTLGSGQFIIVDDYGRLHGAEIIGQDGIKAEVDSNINNPRVIFSANFDGEEGIDASGIKLRNYELDEENTGNIEAMDSLEVALNKVENKININNEEFNTFRTYTTEEEDPYSEQRLEFWNEYHNNITNDLLVSYVHEKSTESLIMIETVGNGFASHFDVLNDCLRDLNPAAIKYSWNAETEKWETNQEGTCYKLEDVLRAYFEWWDVDDTSTRFEGLAAQLYDDKEDFSPIFMHTVENLVEDFPKAKFEYEVQPEILLEQDAQDYWDYYLQTINTFKGDNTLLKTFISVKKVDNVTEEQFMAGEYYYDTLNPTGESSTNTGSYLSFWDRYVKDSTYHSEYQYYIYSQATFYWLLSPTDEGFIRVVQKENGQWKNIDSIEDFRILYSHMDKEIFGYDKTITGAPPFITLSHIYNALDPNTAVPQINLYTTGIQLLKKHYFNSQHPFEKNIHISTDDYIFKPVNLSTSTYQPNKYYLRGYGGINNFDVPFYFLSTSDTFNSNKIYFELQESPFKEQEREVMGTSLMDLCDLLYGVGSLYNTSTNVGVETETGSGIYTLPNMPGKWELIHKKFKSLQIGETATEEPSETDIITWNADNTTIHTTGSDPTHCLVKREGNQIQLRLRWYSKGAASSSTKTIGKFNFQNVGLNSFGWADYGHGESDAWKAMLIVWIVNGSGNIQLRDVISMGTSYPTTEDVLCTATFNIIASNAMMDDSACDEFTFKRVS